jgi:hypothetical protein
MILRGCSGEPFPRRGARSLRGWPAKGRRLGACSASGRARGIGFRPNPRGSAIFAETYPPRPRLHYPFPAALRGGSVSRPESFTGRAGGARDAWFRTARLGRPRKISARRALRPGRRCEPALKPGCGGAGPAGRGVRRPPKGDAAALPVEEWRNRGQKSPRGAPDGRHLSLSGVRRAPRSLLPWPRRQGGALLEASPRVGPAAGRERVPDCHRSRQETNPCPVNRRG